MDTCRDSGAFGGSIAGFLEPYDDKTEWSVPFTPMNLYVLSRLLNDGIWTPFDALTWPFFDLEQVHSTFTCYCRPTDGLAINVNIGATTTKVGLELTRDMSAP